jgi:hypothetical protein
MNYGNAAPSASRTAIDDDAASNTRKTQGCTLLLLPLKMIHLARICKRLNQRKVIHAMRYLLHSSSMISITESVATSVSPPPDLPTHSAPLGRFPELQKSQNCDEILLRIETWDEFNFLNRIC